MSDKFKIGDGVLTEENSIARVVEIDPCTVAPDKLVKIRIGKNVYVWVKMSKLNNLEVIK